MKYKLLLIITILFLASSGSQVQAEEIIKRRPDQAEFVTESHVRLTAKSLAIAEIAESTPASQSTTSFWVYLTQSVSSFLQSLRNIFRLN
ncbi:MAG: hypothetical protein Fur0011_0940 [Candidatus Microgenomates bacterium]